MSSLDPVARGLAVGLRGILDRSRRRQPVATRAGALGGTGSPNLSSGATSATYRTRHFLLKDADVSDIVLRYDNWYLDNTAGGEVDGASPITIKAAIEYGSKLYPVRFNGSRTVTISPGGFVYSDPIGITFTRNTNINSRTYVSVPASGSWPLGKSYIGEAGDGTNIANGGADVVDQTGAIATNTAGGTPLMFYPTSVLGTASIPRAKATFILGDSIGAGAEFAGSATGDIGYLKIALANNVGVVEHCRSAYELRVWDGSFVGTPGGHPRGGTFMDGCTSAIFEIGVNDVFNGAWANLAQAQGYYSRAWREAQSRGLKVYQTTMTPQVTPESNPATLAGQIAKPNSDLRLAINDWIRTVPQYLDGCFDVAALVQAPENPRLWIPGYCGDGVHPKAATHAMIAASGVIDLSKL